MSENTNSNASIFSKMAKIMAGLSSFKKDKLYKSTMSNVQYNYVGAEQVFDKIRQLMAENGLVIIPSNPSYEVDESGMYTINYIYTICCADTGATYSAEWKTMAMRHKNDDKVMNKAATQGLKYFLMTTFIVNGGEDDEDSTDHEETAAPKSSQPKPQKPSDEPQNNAEFGEIEVDAITTRESAKTAGFYFEMIADDVRVSTNDPEIFAAAGIDMSKIKTTLGNHKLDSRLLVRWKQSGKFKNAISAQIVVPF